MNEIDEYIEEHRESFTREALTEKLLEAGHDPSAIEAAWIRIDRADAARATASGRPGSGTYALAVLLGLGYGAACIAALVAVGMGGAVAVLMLVYVAAMIAAAAWSIARLLAAPRRGGGTSAIAAAVAISVVVFVGLSGACFALVGPAINASGGL